MTKNLRSYINLKHKIVIALLILRDVGYIIVKLGKFAIKKKLQTYLVL